MGRETVALPHWTWNDLEIALSHFGKDHLTARSTQDHLLQGLRESASSLEPTELLKEVLSTAWVIGSLAVSATSRRPATDWDDSFSSSSSPS